MTFHTEFEIGIVLEQLDNLFDNGFRFWLDRGFSCVKVNIESNETILVDGIEHIRSGDILTHELLLNHRDVILIPH